MPGGLLQGDDVDKVAEWLAAKNKEDANGSILFSFVTLLKYNCK